MSKYETEYLPTVPEGETPLSPEEWKKQRLAEGRAQAAARKAEAQTQENLEPPKPPVPEIPEVMIFWAENRNRVEIMSPGGKTVINGQIVVQPHRTIEFIEHHWTAHMEYDDDREKAEWLLKCRALKTGEIVVVPNVKKSGGPMIQTGPRTSLTPKTRHETIERPASTREAVEALSAPLHQ